MVMRDGSYVLNTCPRTGKYMDLETHYIKGKHTGTQTRRMVTQLTS